jgi:opacity protein-like surface antigen
MQTDFGERHHFPSSVLNIGYGAGLVYYISSNPDRSYWNQRGDELFDHIKLRFEFSYMKDHLIQRGRYIKGNSTQAILLKAIVSDVRLINSGVQLEYSIFKASDGRYLEPYLSFGGIYTFYKPQVKSIFGDLETNPSLLPNAYRNGIHNEGGNTGSFTLGAGTTYTTNSDLKFVADFRWQRFLKDDIDGLTPLISANKYNDWLFYLNFGIVFKLN